MPIIFRPNKVGSEPDSSAIPENCTAQLMHYFDCVCSVLDLDFIEYNIQKLRSYRNYYNLTDGEKRTLFMLCGLFSVDVMRDKCIIENEALCDDEHVKFFSLLAVKTIVEPIKYIEIGELQIKVIQIMFYKESWIKKFYHKPMEYFHSLYSHLNEHRKPATTIDASIVRTTSSPVQHSDRKDFIESTKGNSRGNKHNGSLSWKKANDSSRSHTSCCSCSIL